MNNDVVISFQNVSKEYKLYSSNRARLLGIFVKKVPYKKKKAVDNVKEKFMKLALEFKVNAKVEFSSNFNDILNVIAEGVPEETAKQVIEQVFGK